MAEPDSVTVLCGGVGAARFLRGLVEVIPPERITAIVNVADDMVLHGLHISPDVDTVVYTLADAIDPDRGWGLRNETWSAMEALRRFGDGDWFSLGDRDLGTHLHRTQRLAEGATLTQVTDELRRAWDVRVRVIPITDDPVRTHVTLLDSDREIPFQEYFVGLGHAEPISAVRFDGAESARLTDAARAAIVDADLVVIAPSNPLVSIGPLLAVDSTRALLSERRQSTVAISPIVGGNAIKGPAARMLTELGHEPSTVGVARLYRDICDVLMIDDTDAATASAVATAGCVPFVTDTIMATTERAAALAARTCTAPLEPGPIRG